MTLKFSDGTHEVLKLLRLSNARALPLRNGAEWVILTELIQADEPSPFPALTQIELFGQNK